MTKIDIIAGFYGAGKTRFIKNMMKEGINKGEVAYLKCSSCEGELDAFAMEVFGINGFETKIDSNTEFLEEALISALRNILELYEPSRILIETAGNMSLSKTIEVVNQVLVPKWIAMNAIVTIVNAINGVNNIEKFSNIFREQIENAQTIVLSNTEEVSEEELYACEVALRKFNSHATVLVAPWDELEGSNLRNSIEITSRLESIVRHIASKEKLPLVYDRKKSVQVDVWKEQKEIEGMIIHTDKIVEEEQMKALIEEILLLKQDIIRIKGDFLNRKGESVQVDYVQGKIMIRIEKNRGTGNIQIIGKKLVRQMIEKCVLQEVSNV